MIKIVQVKSQSELLKFARFKNRLYKGDPYNVPELIVDELATLSPSKNPAFEFCQAAQFLCYQDDEIVGRICAFINHRANEKWQQQRCRFGWYDFVEREDVAQALMQAASDWGRSQGMDTIVGPMGFTDMDQEGMLTEGFDQLGTMATMYNYPYYPKFMEQMGFTKDASWMEFKIFMPKELPQRFMQMSEIVLQRNNLKVLKYKNIKELIDNGWGHRLFELLNRAYAPLYGFSELSKAQIDKYLRNYISMVRLELLCFVVDNENSLVGYGVAMPSLARALQRSHGKMFPWGFVRLIRALKAKKVPSCELLIIAVDPAYQNKGVNAVIFANVLRGFRALGSQWAESNPELEVNDKMKAHWDGFDHIQHKRRAAFIKKL
ncbi:MAG: N-acetyltransferase [Mucinivorans sp.]